MFSSLLPSLPRQTRLHHLQARISPTVHKVVSRQSFYLPHYRLAIAHSYLGTLSPSTTTGIIVATVVTSAVIAGLIAYLLHRYRRKQKAGKQILDNDMYFKPELSGESRKKKVELSGDREIVEMETNEQWQELEGAK